MRKCDENILYYIYIFVIIVGVVGNVSVLFLYLNSKRQLKKGNIFRIEVN